MNGEMVGFIPMMPTHLGGDTIVSSKANVIYIGLHRNFVYPFADQANGGSINGMVEAIDMMGHCRRQHRFWCRPWNADHRKDLPYRAMLLDILAR